MRPKPVGVPRAAYLAPAKHRAPAGRNVLASPARADSSGEPPYLPGDFFTSAAPIPPTPSTAPGSSTQRSRFNLSALWDAAGRSATTPSAPSASSPRLGGREELGQRTFFTPTFDDDRWRQPMSRSASAPDVPETLSKPTLAVPGTSRPARPSPPPGVRSSGGGRSWPSVASSGPADAVLHSLAPAGATIEGSGSPARASTHRSFSPTLTSPGSGGRRRPPQPESSPGESEADDEPPSAVLSDAAWHGRLSAVIAHLHGTLPRFFPDPPHFPPAVFSPAITLVLPAPPSLPLLGSSSSNDPSGGPGGVERAPEVHLRGTRAYSLFFAAARASLGIVLRDPYVRIESVRVVPATEKEGFVVVPNQLPPSATGASSRPQDGASSMGGAEPTFGSSSKVPHAGLSAGSAPAVQISRARLDRVVRVRVKVGGRLRLPSLGPASAVVEALGGRVATNGGDPSEREWTISNLYGLSPLSARITRHTVESVYPLPGEGAQAWLSGQLAASPAAAGGGGESGGSGHQQGGCAGAVEIDLDELRDAPFWRETKDDAVLDGRRDGAPGQTG